LKQNALNNKVLRYRTLKNFSGKSAADLDTWCRLPTLILGVGLQKFLKEEREGLINKALAVKIKERLVLFVSAIVLTNNT
jgi:hypothetical protein